MYDVFYDDGEEAQSYVDEHRFDCFSRTLMIRKHYE